MVITGLGIGQGVEDLVSKYEKHEVLGSIPSTTKKKERKKNTLEAWLKW
jgi:hypothetical protein